jgi:putative ABC transport system ATP-binding protein
MPLIELQHIGKQYSMGEISLKVLDDICLTVNSGEYAAILGPSGSGKSTLMNILGCLDTPSSGEYFFNGQAISQLNRRALAKMRAEHIGFIFQSFNLLDYATALDNVALPLLYRGVSKKLRQQRAQTLLEQVGLHDRLHHKPQELSGGQRQRVAIARALVGNPSLLLADEPTGNLDSSASQQVLQLLNELSQQGKTILMVTHDLEIAAALPRTITIRDGHLANQ